MGSELPTETEITGCCLCQQTTVLPECGSLHWINVLEWGERAIALSLDDVPNATQNQYLSWKAGTDRIVV